MTDISPADAARLAAMRVDYGNAECTSAEADKIQRDVTWLFWLLDAAQAELARLTKLIATPSLAHREEVAVLNAEIERLRALHDAQMLRVKACEHIAEAEEGWEVLRNECPSTAAVAALRDAYDALRAQPGDAMDAAACSCVDVLGEDPDCPFHGVGTEHWADEIAISDAARTELVEFLRAQKLAITAAEDRARQTEAVKMEELRLSCARILGNPDTWPSHGNAPLAIAAVIRTLVAAHNKAVAERQAGEAELAKAQKIIKQLCVAHSSWALGKEAGMREGIEMAAQWHDKRSAELLTVADEAHHHLDYQGEVLARDARWLHATSASTLRALPPAAPKGKGK